MGKIIGIILLVISIVIAIFTYLVILGASKLERNYENTDIIDEKRRKKWMGRIDVIKVKFIMQI